MKTVMTVAVVSAALALSAQAQQGDSSPFTPDQPYYDYSGDQQRGGIISSTRVTDSVYGTATCNSGPFIVDFPDGEWFIGGRVTVRNMFPATCGPLSYTMQNRQVSVRTDGLPDHINQSGAAWWTSYAAIYSAYEACNLIGYTGPPYYSTTALGDPYVISNSQAGCGGIPVQ